MMGSKDKPGVTIATVKVQSDDQCGTLGPCPEYPLELKAPGKRLRVAIDTPQRSDTFALEVIDPSGNVKTSKTSNRFNAEVLVPDPVAGA